MKKILKANTKKKKKNLTQMKSNTFLEKKKKTITFLMEAAPRFAAILVRNYLWIQSLDKHLLTRGSEYFDLTLLCQDKRNVLLILAFHHSLRQFFIVQLK